MVSLLLSAAVGGEGEVGWAQGYICLHVCTVAELTVLQKIICSFQLYVYIYPYTLPNCAHITAECIQGVLPAETINLYGPSSRNAELSESSRSKLYVFPSMNFSCDGTITDIRMRMDCEEGSPGSQSQEVVVYFLLFHDGLNSPTRRVTHILLDQTNTQQELPNEIWTNSDPLSLPVTEGSFIGFAIPSANNKNRIFKNINLPPSSISERVDGFFFSVTAPFSTFEGTVLEATRTADSSQFTLNYLMMIRQPLINLSFSK